MLFFLHSLVDIFCKAATAYLLHSHFIHDNLVRPYLSRMARGDHQNNDDDFMDPPQRNRAAGRIKEGDEVNVHTSPPQSCFMLLVHTSNLQSSNMD